MTRSFRDPSGSCWPTESKVLRVLDPAAATAMEAFLQTDAARGFLNKHQLVATRRLTGAELNGATDLLDPQLGKDGVVFEHERIWFPSYPYEWPPEMLWAAGQLTLDLAVASMTDGYCLKDATPYNVLFRGPEPVFIDVPSFERCAPGDPVWRPYAQFVRTFLLPLLANRSWGLRPSDIFATHRDGLQPQDLYPLCGPLARLKPRLLSLVSMPTWLNSRARRRGRELYQTRLMSPEKASFILESLFGRLRRSLRSLKPKRPNSTWSDYMGSHSYNEQAFAAKEQFVSGALAEFKPRRVLDAGANTGHFSMMAAKNGADVVAIDFDPACAGAIWDRVRAEKLDILPLVIDLARPSPALGWRNAECPSFLERATGAFDCVFMLALIHHLLVTERIPLDEILGLASSLTSSIAVIELVLPQDEMFQELTRGRDHLHADFTQATFEKASARYFEILRSTETGTHRRLYLLKRKAVNVGPA